MRVKIFTTGGTIDKVYYDAKDDFQVGEPEVSTVLKNSNVSFGYDVEMVLKKDSLELTDSDRALIVSKVAASKDERVLITHGTDTMIETALALCSVSNKVIVLTGSMQPARFHITDAVFNIGFALGVLMNRERGVYIAINGAVFDPHHCKKDVSNNTFESV